MSNQGEDGYFPVCLDPTFREKQKGEAFSGHPLADRGFKPYSVAEVEQSSWIRRLAAMNAVHPSHKPELFAAYRHFIFAFHDSIFECVVKDFTVRLLRGSLRAALHKMTEKTVTNF